MELRTTKLSYHTYACVNSVNICAEIVLVKSIDFHNFVVLYGTHIQELMEDF